MTTIATRPLVHPATNQGRYATAQTVVPHHASWTERLAAWAERQPEHRRLGCWTVS
jgi:hypothetical protein